MDTSGSNLDNTRRRFGDVDRPPVDAVSFALAEVLRALRDGCGDDELRPMLRGLCANARREHLRAEQLIIVVKGAWGALPALTSLTPPSDQVDELAHIVRLLVDEYYDRPLTADA